MKSVSAAFAVLVTVAVCVPSLCVARGGGIGGASQTASAAVIVPNQSASTEGDGYSGVFSAPLRLQEVYAASHFPAGPISINEIRFRPDASQGAFTATLKVRMSLSTTAKAPDGLSTTFAENIGPDETVVLDREAIVSSAAAGTPAKAFDVVFRLGREFVYDPSKGNLLLDIRAYADSCDFKLDASSALTDNASRVFNYGGKNADADVADYFDSAADIVEFAHSEEGFKVIINPAGGTFTNSVQVALIATVLGGEVRFTLDGSEPVAASSLYTSPLTLQQSATLQARAFTNGAPATPIASAAFSIVEDHSGSVVVPEEFANAEGGSYSRPFAAPIRLQEVYAASQFPPSRIYITQIRFRPDASAGGFGATLKARLTLSTTAKAVDALSSTFANNTGPDATVVFDKQTTVSSAGTGNPRNIDVTFPLETAFAYDPSEGNLLLDIQVYSCSAEFNIDCSFSSTDKGSRIYSPGADVTSTPYGSDTSAEIVAFDYTVDIQDAHQVFINPAGGTFTNSVEVALRTMVPRGEIRFTLDDTEPVATSSLYTIPLTLWQSATLKARAFADGVPASPIAAAEFSIVEAQLPILIQAENFDDGGEGVGYHATSPGNAGGQYRSTDIDIYATTDTDGGYDVILFPPEWLRYTVSVAKDGVYRLEARVLPWVAVSGYLHVLVDGKEASAPMRFPGSLTAPMYVPWQVTSAEGIVLTAGQHVLQLEASGWSGTVGIRINYLRLLPITMRPAVWLAGSEATGFADGPADQAKFSASISGLDADSAGNLYVVDAGNLRIRKVAPNGEASTFAGTGVAGFNDGPGAQARFTSLGSFRSLALDRQDNCYVLDPDYANNLLKIRKITPGSEVSTYWSAPAYSMPISMLSATDQGKLVFVIAQGIGGNSYNYLLSELTPQGQFSQTQRWYRETRMGKYPDDLTCQRTASLYFVEHYYHSQSGHSGSIWAETDTGTRMLYSASPASMMDTYPQFYPVSVAFNAAGEVFFTTERSLSTLVAGGERMDFYGSGSASPLAMDNAGTLYLADGSRIIKFPDTSGLVLNAFAEGGGTVTVPKNRAFSTNATAVVTATPDTGWSFLGWQGDASAADPTLNLTMDTHKVVEAVFGTPVTPAATGGTVTREPDLALYPYGSWVTLTVKTNLGYEFLRWSDGNTNTVRSIAVVAPVDLQPVFSALPQFTLTAQVLAGVGGTVALAPAQANYYRDTKVTLFARPASGYVFQVWLDGDLTNPRVITMSSNTTVFAVFTPGQGTAPDITTPPSDVVADRGQSVTFTVSATGSSPLEYQWSHKGAEIAGATGASLTLPAVQTRDAGLYTVVVRNSVGSANASANLAFKGAVQISGVKAAGGQFQFVINGTAGQRYQIDYSPDLRSWTPLTVLTNAAGAVSYGEAVGAGSRFYRVSVMP